MKSRPAALAVLIAACAAASCGPKAASDLKGTRWIATHIDGGALASAGGGRPTTLEFGHDGRLGGFSGCNDYGAAYRLSRVRIVIEDGVSAHMVGCTGEAAASGTVLFRALNGPYRWDETGLHLGGSDRPTMRFRRADGT